KPSEVVHILRSADQDQRAFLYGLRHWISWNLSLD
ncbi:MAG: hypothetical protein ACI9R8_002542, partial [Candidatus Paceibacteria bacterium]